VRNPRSQIISTGCGRPATESLGGYITPDHRAGPCPAVGLNLPHRLGERPGHRPAAAIIKGYSRKKNPKCSLQVCTLNEHYGPTPTKGIYDR